MRRQLLLCRPDRPRRPRHLRHRRRAFDRRAPGIAADRGREAEAGLPALRITSWTAIQAPTGLPEPLAEAIAAAIRQALADPALGEKAAELGFDLIGADQAASRRFVAAEVARYAQLVAEAHIRAE